MWLDLNLCLANNNGDLKWKSKYVSLRWLVFFFFSFFSAWFLTPKTTAATPSTPTARSAQAGTSTRSGLSASAWTEQGSGSLRRWI
jgi:hypothetical protein